MHNRKGNKATLVSRLQVYEETGVSQNPSSVPGASRKAATAASPLPQAESPGVRPTPEQSRSSASAEFFAFKMPDLTQPPPASAAQVVSLHHHVLMSPSLSHS